MKRVLMQLIYACIILAAIACQEQNTSTDPTSNDNKPKYTQYGTPFKNVPEIQDIVMYEVNLRAFSPSGDIQGVTDRLEQIKALGVNVIWLMPVYPIGQVNSVNSPYSIRDYTSVGAEFGSLNDLRTLTDEAHSKGIAVLLDWVANHTAWDHEWIDHKSWYTQDEEGNIIHPAGTNWLDVADLNYDNREMRAAMIDAMQYWVYEANIDGFRCDYADGIPYDFWREAWQSIDTISGRECIYFAEGSREDHFVAGFDLNFGWAFYGAVKDVFNGEDVNRIYTAHNNEYKNISAGKHWLRFTTNHDESAWDATPVDLFNGIDGALAASVVTIFTGGVPLIYGSQEVGTVDPVPFFTNSTIQWNDHPEMLAAYRELFQFYKDSQVAKSGENTIFQHSDIVCFKKSLDNEEIIVIVNVRDATVNYTIPSELAQSVRTDVITKNSVPLNEQITLEPYQYYILE